MSKIGIRMQRVDCPACRGTGGIAKADPRSLKDIRQRAGLSLRALGARGGVSAPYLSDVELGRRTANERVLAIYRGIC